MFTSPRCPRGEVSASNPRPSSCTTSSTPSDPGRIGHHHLGGPGVLAGVDQGFLHDPQRLPAVARLQLAPAGQPVRSRRRRPSAAWSARRCAGRRPRPARARDASRSPVSSSNSSSRSPCVTESSVWCSWSNSGATSRDGLRRQLGHAALHESEPQHGRSQRLHRLVVHVRRDPGPFRLLRVDQPTGQTDCVAERRPRSVAARSRTSSAYEMFSAAPVEQSPHLVVEGLGSPGVDRQRADDVAAPTERQCGGGLDAADELGRRRLRRCTARCPAPASSTSRRHPRSRSPLISPSWST